MERRRAYTLVEVLAREACFGSRHHVTNVRTPSQQPVRAGTHIANITQQLLKDIRGIRHKRRKFPKGTSKLHIRDTLRNLHSRRPSTQILQHDRRLRHIRTPLHPLTLSLSLSLFLPQKKKITIAHTTPSHENPPKPINQPTQTHTHTHTQLSSSFVFVFVFVMTQKRSTKGRPSD